MRAMEVMLAVPFVALIIWSLVEYLSPETMLALLTGATFCR